MGAKPGTSRVRQSVRLSACLSVSVCLSVCLSVSLPACLPVCLSVCRSKSLYVCLSVCLSVCLPVVLPLVLPVRLGLGGAAPPSFLPLLLVFGWGGSLVGPGSLGVLARLGLGWAPARSETSFQVSPDFVNVQGGMLPYSRRPV